MKSMKIKRSLWMLLTLLTIATKAMGQTPLQQAQQADEYYRAGDYAAAVEAYEAVLQSGHTSADLYYNLGNAYYRTGENGRAILNYRRALRLAPHMRDAQENLALAESHTTDRITAVPKLFLVRWWDSLSSLLTKRGWGMVVIILLVLLSAASMTAYFGRSRQARKWGVVSAMALILIELMALALMLRAGYLHRNRREAVVVKQAITIKASPEEQAVDKFILHEGAAVRIEDELAGWYKITLADGNTGWASNSDVERV